MKNKNLLKLILFSIPIYTMIEETEEQETTSECHAIQIEINQQRYPIHVFSKQNIKPGITKSLSQIEINSEINLLNSFDEANISTFIIRNLKRSITLDPHYMMTECKGINENTFFF